MVIIGQWGSGIGKELVNDKCMKQAYEKTMLYNQTIYKLCVCTNKVENCLAAQLSHCHSSFANSMFPSALDLAGAGLRQRCI